jgi:hypothetical protein
MSSAEGPEYLGLLLETSYSHNLPLPLLRTPRLPDFAFLGYLCCGVCYSVMVVGADVLVRGE